jgi:hypothetical protein
VEDVVPDSEEVAVEDVVEALDSVVALDSVEGLDSVEALEYERLCKREREWQKNADNAPTREQIAACKQAQCHALDQTAQTRANAREQRRQHPHPHSPMLSRQKTCSNAKSRETKKLRRRRDSNPARPPRMSQDAAE